MNFFHYHLRCEVGILSIDGNRIYEHDPIHILVNPIKYITTSHYLIGNRHHHMIHFVMVTMLCALFSLMNVIGSLFGKIESSLSVCELFLYSGELDVLYQEEF